MKCEGTFKKLEIVGNNFNIRGLFLGGSHVIFKRPLISSHGSGVL